MKHLLITRIINLADKFRLGQSVAASQILPFLLQEILTEQDYLPPALIKALLHCQEQQDWLGLADYLEYELVHDLMPPQVSSATCEI